MENYAEFLAQRRELIATAFNRRMDSLVAEIEPTVELGIADLIKSGEGPTVEFKASLRWDVVKGHVNKDLQRGVTKTIAAMLNSEGGSLLIGVADDGSAFGIESDMSSLGKKDLDGFGQALAVLTAETLGPEFAPFIHHDFHQYQGVTVCRVRVEASPKPAFHRSGPDSDFFVRVGNTTRPLDAQATHEYIGMHWEA